MALMLTAELVSLGRIVARLGPVAHFGQFGRGEQLELPHTEIIPQPGGELQTSR